MIDNHRSPELEIDNSAGTERGFTKPELLGVLTIMAIVFLVIALPFRDSYERHELRSATAKVEMLALQARIKALKEKVPYRLLIHDESAATPNRLELQRRPASTWVTVDGGTHNVGRVVSILGSGSTDSMNEMMVDARGVCQTGNVHLASTSGKTRSFAIEPMCMVLEIQP